MNMHWILKKHWRVLTLLAACSTAPLHAVTVYQCNTSIGFPVWTNSGCATASVFGTYNATLDWGSPTGAGSWALHPAESGLGSANNNTWNVSTQGQWMATASDGTNIGLGVGNGVATSDQVLVRTDDALQFYDPVNSGGWAPFAGTTNPYYSGYSVFGGHADSAPINTAAAGGFSSTTNTTDQFYTGPYFWDHGNPSQAGPSSTAVPYVGDHLLGFNVTHDQPLLISFTNQGVDGVAFSVAGRSNTQTNGQAAAQMNWLAGAGTTPNGIFEIMVRAYDNVNPNAGALLYSYEVEVNSSFGTCTTLSNPTPVPCNDAPVLALNGTKGLFNIRSIVISSSTDSLGFFVDELHLDQGAPEPAEALLIGSGLIFIGITAKRRGLFRR